jgi:catechol 2,3-dioxygenase-like lactoylglutathione lyase family enzyme
MKIDSLDHVVLTVKDIDSTCTFYAKVLGMEIVAYGENRKALSFGSQKINLQQLGRESALKAEKPHTRFSRCVLYHFCVTFRRYRPPEFLRCKSNRRANRKKWGERADDVGVFP